MSVASQYAPLYLSTWLGGKAKVTVCWRVLGWLTTMAMLLALAWLVGVRCAIGCVPVSGLDALTTLGSGAGVCMHTLELMQGLELVLEPATPLELMQGLELALGPATPLELMQGL